MSTSPIQPKKPSKPVPANRSASPGIIKLNTNLRWIRPSTGNIDPTGARMREPTGTLDRTNKAGALFVTVGEVAYRVTGAVHKVTGPGKTEGAVRYCMEPDYVSPGFDPESPRNRSRILERRGKPDLVRVVGVFKRVKKATPPPVNAAPSSNATGAGSQTKSDKAPASAAADAANRMQKPVEAVARAKKKVRTTSDYVRELESVRGALLQGFDPDVQLWFVAKFLKTSRSTLYRTMATNQFPRGFLRNGRHLWRFSVIESYRQRSAVSAEAEAPKRDQSNMTAIGADHA